MPFALDKLRPPVLCRKGGRRRIAQPRRWPEEASLMRNLLAFIGAVVLVVGGLGLYLGWFKVQKQSTTDPGTTRYQIDVDQSKIQHDVQGGVQAIKGQLGQPTPATTGPTPATTGSAPSSSLTPPPARANPGGPYTPTAAPQWRPSTPW
jgi:hypothetical protein